MRTRPGPTSTKAVAPSAASRPTHSVHRTGLATWRTRNGRTSAAVRVTPASAFRTTGIFGSATAIDSSSPERRAAAGLIGFTKAAARELAHWAILVNAVAPGLIETDMAAALPAEARGALLAQVPLKRIGTAREVAEMVRFLAGDGAAYVTGQVFHVNGGLYM